MSVFAELLHPRCSASRRDDLRVRLYLEDLEDRRVPTVLGQQLFPTDNPWNQVITSAPVSENSASIIANIVSRYGDGRLHPDFGQDSFSNDGLFGIPYNVVHGNSQPSVHVVIDAYSRESDIQDAPIPDEAVLEGDLQNGPNFGDRGDSHLLVYDADNNIGYEFFAVSRPNENIDGQWHADQESIWDFNQDTFRTLGWTSADAAGLPILPGLVRPDEGLPQNQGGEGAISHAIRFTLPSSVVLRQFIYPASHQADSGRDPTTQVPLGARFRLRADVDISNLNPESRIVAQAMKDYGLILADNGSPFYFSGASYAVDSDNGIALTWNDGDIQDSNHGLKSLHFSDFEVVDLTPIVSDLDIHVGSAGTTVTVIGQNFSGAAGNIQVWFGDQPALSVTVLDDNNIVAVAPPGSGTVDVTVESGVDAGADSENYTNPIFGYGDSAISDGDQFTYTDVLSQPLSVLPEVATGFGQVANHQVAVGSLSDSTPKFNAAIVSSGQDGLASAARAESTWGMSLNVSRQESLPGNSSSIVADAPLTSSDASPAIWLNASWHDGELV